MSRFSSWRPQQQRRLLQTLCSPTCLLPHLPSFITFFQTNMFAADCHEQTSQLLPSSILPSNALHRAKSLSFLESPQQPHLPLLHHVIATLSKPRDPFCQRSDQFRTGISAGIDWASCRGVILGNFC